MYRQQPQFDPEQCAAFGLTAEDYAEDDIVVDIWPENLDSINAFVSMQTQWRIGMNGATGFDYSVVPAIFDLQELAAARRKDVFNDLRIMELAALKARREKTGGG